MVTIKLSKESMHSVFGASSLGFELFLLTEIFSQSNVGVANGRGIYFQNWINVKSLVGLLKCNDKMFNDIISSILMSIQMIFRQFEN